MNDDAPSCQLCGHTDRRELGTRLVHWRASLPGMSYEHVVACREPAACRARVQAQGDIWPLVETSQDLRSA